MRVIHCKDKITIEKNGERVTATVDELAPYNPGIFDISDQYMQHQYEPGTYNRVWDFESNISTHPDGESWAVGDDLLERFDEIRSGIEAQRTVIEAAAAKAEADAVEAAMSFREKRERAYNEVGVTRDAMIVAIWEARVESRPEAMTALQTKRLEIKALYPKPE